MTTERDTKFLGSAGLLLPDVSKLFFTMYAHIEEHKDIQEIDSIEDEIRTLIAQYAYDLVEHTLKSVPDIIPEVQSLNYALDLIPDLTEWPSILPPAQKQ